MPVQTMEGHGTIAKQKVIYEINTRGVGTCPQVGGKRTGILRENVYFEAIFMKFQQKWGGSCPPVSNTPVKLTHYTANVCRDLENAK